MVMQHHYTDTVMCLQSIFQPNRTTVILLLSVLILKNNLFLPGLLVVNPARFCGGGISDSGVVETLCVLGVSLVLM